MPHISLFTTVFVTMLVVMGCNQEEPADYEAMARNAPGVTWSETIEVSSGEAYQGPWRMNESDFRYVDAPTAALDAEGRVGIAWADQAEQDIFFQRYDTAGEAQLDEPVNISRSPDIFSWLPRMAMSEDGSEVYLLWQDIVFSGGSHGGEIFFARTVDGGQTFSQPINLSNTPAGAGKGRLTAQRWDNGSLDITMAPDGTLYAAWTEYEGTLWVSRSTDGGESFSDPLAVAEGGDVAPARGPDLAVDSENRVYLAWTVGEDPAADVRVASSEDGGASFSEPRVVGESNGHSDAPKIVVDSEGTLHLVYAESREGAFGRYHLRYTRSADGGETFEEPREIVGTDIGGVESVHYPALSLDGRDNLYLVWELFPNPRERSRGLGFTLSRDGGGTFATPSIVPGTADPELGFNGSLQGLLMRKLAVNDAGNLAVVNSTFRMNEMSRVRLIRGEGEDR